MKRPKVRAPRDWSFPTPLRDRLDNGLRVLAFRRPGQYVVSAGLVLDIPLTAEPRDLEGVASLALRTLDEGTRSHPGLSFTETLEREGAALGGTVGYSAAQLFLDVPANRLDRALPLLAEAVREPTLADDDIVRQRALRLAEIEQTLAHPGQRAGLAFRETTIGGRYRAARPTGGDRAGVAAVEPADVRAFHEQHYSPVGATLVLAGDFESDPLAAAAAAFSSWDAPGRDVLQESPLAGPRGCLLLDRPRSVQADVRLGRFGIDRTDPRWPDLQMGSYALGGAFLSRLNRVLREERGYTYGVHLVNQPMRTGGLISVQGSFRTEVAAAAVIEAAELLRLDATPFTDAEIADAVNYAIGVTPLRYATAEGIVEQVAALVSVGLSSDYVDAYAAALRRVTPSSATLATSQALAGELNLVVVGDAATIAPPLVDAGWPLQVVPFEG